MNVVKIQDTLKDAVRKYRFLQHAWEVVPMDFIH